MRMVARAIGGGLGQIICVILGRSSAHCWARNLTTPQQTPLKLNHNRDSGHHTTPRQSPLKLNHNTNKPGGTVQKSGRQLCISERNTWDYHFLHP